MIASLLVMSFLSVTHADLKNPVHVSRIQGMVQLVRNNVMKMVQGPSALSPGDAIRTLRTSATQIESSAGKLDFGSHSTAKIEKITKTKELQTAELLYGSFHLQLEKDMNIQTPQAKIALGKGEYVVHVFRNQEEFSKGFAGLFLEAPTLGELGSLSHLKTLFTHIGCLAGRATIELKDGRSTKIIPGEALQLTGSQADAVPSRVGVDEMKLSAKSFGFNVQ